jgi:predicted 3-demethylubiquinone-9 3-methyltransferase (glyoxalase superfamily)
MQKIVPFLWYRDNKAEEAANFYVSIIRGAKISEILRAGKAGPGPGGSVITVSFTIGDLEIVALNGNPQFEFTMANSLLIHGDTQDEIDEYWEKLSAGGQKIQCGWLTDKYGVAWQIAPPILRKMLSDKDPEKAARVMKAMMQMTKIEIETLRKAYEGK